MTPEARCGLAVIALILLGLAIIYRVPIVRFLRKITTGRD